MEREPSPLAIIAGASLALAALFAALWFPVLF